MTFTATRTVRTTALPPMLYGPAARVGKQKAAILRKINPGERAIARVIGHEPEGN
jgi:hypothetical protein